LLDCHPEIAQWYEPYYLWRKYFLCKDSEVWKPEEYNEAIKGILQKEHRLFLKKTRKKVLVEKMPSHAFNIGYILKIFPEAKFIHIIRDGRDVTLSIKKEGSKRRETIRQKDYLRSFRTASTVLKRAPFLRYKMMLAMFELRSNFSLKPSKYLNKAKWKGNIGWGPRFEGWEDSLSRMKPLQFNATQWVKTVQAAEDNWPLIKEGHRLKIHYEDLVKDPRQILKKTLGFIGLSADERFFQHLPALKQQNFNKWKKEFSSEEISQIKPVLAPLLERLSYSPTDE